MLAIFAVGLGLPPVAVGLAVAYAFWRSGPFGATDLLYTPFAMAVAQIVIANGSPWRARSCWSRQRSS